MNHAQDYVRAIANGDKTTATSLLYRSSLENHPLLAGAQLEKRRKIVGVTWQDRAERLEQEFAEESAFWSHARIVDSTTRVVEPGASEEAYFLIEHPSTSEPEWRCIVMRMGDSEWQVDEKQRTHTGRIVAYIPDAPCLFSDAWLKAYEDLFSGRAESREPSELVVPVRVFAKEHEREVRLCNYSVLSNEARVVVENHVSVLEVATSLNKDVGVRLAQIAAFGRVLLTFAELGAPVVYLPTTNVMVESAQLRCFLARRDAAADELGAVWVSFQNDGEQYYTRGMSIFGFSEIEVPIEDDLEGARDLCANIAIYCLQSMTGVRPGDTLGSSGGPTLCARHGRRGPSDNETYGIHGSVRIERSR
ncbi:MAG: hypothetical protein H6726_29730 [Sandaracinaceae bacterium]|nr:hypothetical protein [Sandaracinaceae bacterium]